MPPEKFKHILSPENPRPTTSASTHKTKKSCSIFRLKLQCTYLIAREPLSRAFTYKCIGISVTWGPSKASRASSGNPFGRWSGGAVIHAWQLQEGQWHSQDNTAVPSAPGCHNHPWSNSPHEYYGRVTQASDTGDIHHFQRAGIQTWTTQHKYTLVPSLLPTPIACCNPPWSNHTKAPALSRAGNCTGSLLGTRPPRSCTELHCTDFTLYGSSCRAATWKNCKSQSAKWVSLLF